MVCTHLLIFNREDAGTFAKDNTLVFFENVELPLNEFIVIRVVICRDEGSTEANEDPKLLEVFPTQAGEILQPVEWILKGRD